MSNNLQPKTINEMETQMLILNEKVTHLENMLEKQSKQITNQNHVIYCLIGGLFNPSTQGKTIASHLELLFEDFTREDKEYYLRNEFNQYNKWDILPTTRQGDENEKRIEQLETKLNTILEIIQEEELTAQEGIELQEDVRHSIVSDDSSVPSLMENSETNSIMTDEIDDNYDW